MTLNTSTHPVLNFCSLLAKQSRNGYPDPLRNLAEYLASILARLQSLL